MNQNRIPPHKILQMEKNNKSVFSMKKALLYAIEQPNEANKELIESCTSQGKISSLDIESLGITSMSLNALKKSCERVLEGGFKEIDLLRIRARSVYEQHLTESNVKSGTKTYYFQQLTELKKENQNLIDSSVFLASKYYDLLHLTKRMIKRACEETFVPENETRLLEQHLEKFDYKKFGNLKIYDGGRK